MKQILIVIIFFLINGYTFGQRKLTKDEILRYWNSSSDDQTSGSDVIVNSSSALNVQLIKIVDSLQIKKVDSLIIFSTALPGYSSISKCDTGIFPVTSFIIWHKDNITHIRKIRGKCLSEIIRDSLASLFNFFDKNYEKVNSEFFMPVIIGGQMTKTKTVSYSMGWVDHEPNYSFYYKIRENKKSFQFCQSYFDNKESLFHDYNLNLCAYQWWQLIKQEVDKIE